MRLTTSVSTVPGLVCLGLIVSSSPILADKPQVEVSAAVRHDVSPPLHSMSAKSPGAEQRRDRPLRPIPQNVLVTNAPDPVVQQARGPLVGTTTGLNFAGVGQGDYGFSDRYAPPDTNGAVGATQYVQWVNDQFAVFDKTTGAIAGGFPKPGNAPWAGFGTPARPTMTATRSCNTIRPPIAGS